MLKFDLDIYTLSTLSISSPDNKLVQNEVVPLTVETTVVCTAIGCNIPSATQNLQFTMYALDWIHDLYPKQIIAPGLEWTG